MKTENQTKLPLIRKRLVQNHSTRSSMHVVSLNTSPTFKYVSSSVNVRNLDEKQLFTIKSSLDCRSGSMETYHGPVGLTARMEFYDSYKNLPKYTQRNRFKGLASSPNLAYLEYVEQAKLKPIPLGVVRRKGNPKDVNLENMRMGDQYAEAFSRGLKLFKSVEKLNLQSNRLTERGSLHILQNIDSSNLIEINLADNKIGSNTVRTLVDILLDSKNSIKHLNLESTCLNQFDVILLSSSLENNHNISKLSLAKNNISDSAAEALGLMIEKNNKIKILDLHWNRIRGAGAVAFFNGLQRNNTLKQLDLSWNAMGREDSLEVTKAMGEALNTNTKLMHLDISYNHFTIGECKLLGEGLLNNHTILGLHVEGNCCTLDSRGFLLPTSSELKGDSGHYFKRMIGSPKYIHHHVLQNCWVCEQWIEVKFNHNSDEQDLDPIFIHLECDNFEPELLFTTSYKNYEITRVVPPDDLKFFFSTLSNSHASKSYPILDLEYPMEKEVSFWDGDTSKIYTSRINTLKIIGQRCDMTDPFLTKPRTPKNKYIPLEGAPERIPWSIPMSIFKDYKFDSDSLLHECFEFDWSYSKIPNLTKNAEDQKNLKDFSKQNYKYILQTFRHLSPFGGAEIPCLTTNSILDFLNNCGIIDSLYSSSDLGVNWNATLLQKVKGQIYNPGNALVRYEFMEILVRVAHDRYVRNGEIKTDFEGYAKMYNEYLRPVISKYDSNIWRETRYLLEDVDYMYKAHKPILDAVYNKYSGKRTLPGQKNFMSLDEFKELSYDAGLLNESYTTRDIDQCYSLGMMTRVDELYKKNHLEMSFVEFLEAFARSCDMSSPRGDLEISSEEAKKLPLHKKIQLILPNLLKLCSQTLKQSFVFLTDDAIERMKYKFPANSSSPKR